MMKTDPFASPGASRLLALLLALAAPQGLAAQDYESGRAAYSERDWAMAEMLWQQEADAGSPEAKLGLGNLYDFGLVGPADPARAFALYREAAEAGLSEAAFNVAVMQDSGVGTPRDLRSAAAWYAFAALGGHDRAGYNLGQLFAGGTEVTQNDAFAAYWFKEAARSIPAAADALDALGPLPDDGEGRLIAPDPLGMQVFMLPTGPEVRIAWQGAAAQPETSFRVELVQIVPDGLAALATARSPGSAVAIPLPDADIGFAWRVVQVSRDSYAASAWQTGTETPLAQDPIGTVRFEYAVSDRRAAGLAFRLGGAMARAGTIVGYAPVEGSIPASRVEYGFSQDAEFAATVAAFLPGIDPENMALSPDPENLPGEVQVSLAFGDAEGTSSDR